MDPEANRSAWVRDVTTGILVFAVFFVILRLVARRIKGLRLGVDDWVLLAATVSTTHHHTASPCLETPVYTCL